MRSDAPIARASILTAALLVVGTLHTPAAMAQTNAGFAVPSADDKALVERAVAAAQKAFGTPAQEVANAISSDMRIVGFLRILTGERAATPPELNQARNEIANELRLLDQAPTWPRPALVHIPYARTKPRIDGKLDDPVWKDALTFRGLYLFEQTNHVDQPSNACYVAWDEDNLYFAFACADTNIVAPPMKRDADVFSYDCVEMFILPDYRLGMYWEIDVSPSGCLFDALNAKRFTGFGLVDRPEENMAGLLTAARIGNGRELASSVVGDKGYVVEVAVPFKELPTYTRGNKPQPGDALNFMLVRLDRNGDAFDCYAVVPLLVWGHNIWNHIPAVLVR